MSGHSTTLHLINQNFSSAVGIGSYSFVFSCRFALNNNNKKKTVKSGESEPGLSGAIKFVSVGHPRGT